MCRAPAAPRPHHPLPFFGPGPVVAQMLNQLGYQQVDVLGVSWGGGLAQQFAYQYPERCRRLILVSTGTGALMVPGNPSALAKIATPRRYKDPARMAQIAGEIYGGKVRKQPELARTFAETAHAGSRLGYLYQLLGPAGWTSVRWLHRIRQPTLILHGDEDPLVPPVNAKIMHRLIRIQSSTFSMMAIWGWGRVRRNLRRSSTSFFQPRLLPDRRCNYKSDKGA